MTNRRPVLAQLAAAAALSALALTLSPVRTLLGPAGTDVSHAAIRDSALLPVLFWCAGWPVAFAPARLAPAVRLAWVLGCLFLLLHIAVAFHLGHGWSHEAAWQHTKQVGGYGDGVYVNYAFALVWLIDALWLCVASDSYRARSRWLSWTVHGFLAFVIFNAAVVFGSRPSRVVFAVGFLLPMLALALTQRTQRGE